MNEVRDEGASQAARKRAKKRLTVNYVQHEAKSKPQADQVRNLEPIRGKERISENVISVKAQDSENSMLSHIMVHGYPVLCFRNSISKYSNCVTCLPFCLVFMHA
ncbi:hypothetical protein ABW21_db0201853 [Orbilia brochopaga]|nr:hypothetical protein ABW21_db0201853 [Drechslerella brochopaga]